ncbi:S66 family peptidase [Rossellomorea sp. BNER]|uniref:S66 family peptidase n=1 Tax=Rossellomorea sp. BNER TaxID=2962031 RepID=UPI003AF220D6|nr:LD-carboxypeptidase [Rossellomorea sp. BNER]
MKKPHRLRLGDTIGICSPSSPIAAHCPRRLQRGVEELEKLGFKVKLAKNSTKAYQYMAGTIDDRVEDLHDLFLDPDVKAIITTIGGTSSHQLFEKLDFKLIKNNPKIFMGYSDITSLHLAIHKKTGLVTYLGPAILPQFGEFNGLIDFTKQYFMDILVDGKPVEYKDSEEFIFETLYWDEKDDRERHRIKNKGSKILNPGNAKGRILAANLSTILLLAGTEYFPDMDGCILCLEDDEGETPAFIDRYLTQLRQLGVYEKINGLVVGRFHEKVGFTEGQLEEIIQRATREYDFPIIYDLDFGHTDPMFILPNGIEAEFKANQNGITFRLLESPVGK